ncbi:lysophospholipase [Fomitiporia mediterranea MF3/22]|uniref:lysophospholipase n=1 Tax=Fomitiporia mediterranea (strain MF3/22) TaxID=694068 RepID=UPI00044080DE|nr:lysophospholipase [Fomitiporia mediterranea MF3/22]EJD05258.1 lysophospholipase [Fomitiporia mediterranea MF3/22]
MLAVSLLLWSSSFWNYAIAQSSPAQQAYTPTIGSCPDGFELVRSAGTDNQVLAANESAYISARDSSVLPSAWNAYLQNVQSKATLPAYAESILSDSSSSFPRLGIAVSGGGYRAAIFGAGVLNALDARNQTSTTAGTAGLLQAATYLAGLSGGSWLVSSAVQANFPDMQTVAFGPQDGSATSDPSGYGGWNAQFDILQPASDDNSNLQFLEGIISEIAGKRTVGFPVTITDVWARLLSRHFANGTHADTFFDDSTTHGAGILFSGLTELSSFKSHNIPFPIITATSHSLRQNDNNDIPGDVIPLSNTMFEFNPFEMGSFDPTLASFTPTKFLGTMNTSVCVTGFDQVSFISGTSSELFNEFNTSAQALAQSPVGPFFALLEQALPQPSSIELDLSLYPNAFLGVSPDTFIDSDQEFLGLIDGGEDGEVIPLQPLLVKARNVDVIVAIDASADTSDGFAAGASLIASKNRTSLFPSAYSFPQVPETTSEFVEQGLASRPTFFGCNDSSPTPLVVYLANGAPPAGQPAITNTSTQQTQYEPAEIQAMLDQTFTIATQGFPANSSQMADPEWPACLACAVVDRVRARQSVQRSGVCETCFARYCWFQ